MTEINGVVGNEEETEIVEMTVIAKAYNVSAKKKISMLGTVRTELQNQAKANLSEIDLSSYELIGNKTLVKQVAVCGTTGEPVYLKLEMTYTNTHPSDLAPKKKSDTNAEGKTVVIYPALNL